MALAKDGLVSITLARVVVGTTHLCSSVLDGYSGWALSLGPDPIRLNECDQTHDL